MPGMAAFRSARRASQRGAAALFAAISLIGVLVAAAFAIDLAQIYIAKRDLQNIANLTALDVARAAGGCLAPDLDRQFVANAAGLASLQRNGGDSSWLVANQVNLGREVEDAAGLRQFAAVAPSEQGQAFAFEVILRRPFPDLVMPLPGFDVAGNPLSARAVGAMAPVASFDVGSFVANVSDPQANLLNELFSNLFDEPLNISLVSYRALVEAPLELADIAAELGSNTLQELLSDPISLPGLLVAVAEALFNAGEATAAVGVNALAAAAPDEDLILGDVIGTPQEAVNGVGEASVNGLELVRAAALQVGEPVLQLTPEITIPGVTVLSGSVTLGQPPTLGIGPALQDGSSALTVATNTQGLVDLRAQVLPGLGLVQANLRLELADVEAELREIRCADRSRSQHEVDLDVRTSVARLVVDNPPANPLINLGPTAVCWEGSVNLGPAQAHLLEFVGPFDPDDPAVLEEQTKTVGSEPGASLSNAISNLLADSPPYVCGPSGGLVLNALLQPVLSGLASGLAPALQAIVDPLVLPLLRGLGANLGGADITLRDVRMPPPALIEAN